MALSITKLPWKAQLALFVLLSIAGAGAFYYFFEIPAQAVLGVVDVVHQRLDILLAALVERDHDNL